MRRIAAALVAVALAGCASIMHGTSQDIGFSSTPTNAKITVDGQPKGQTPVVINLSRKDNHIVRLDLAGYQPFETTLTRSTSGWVWGNIVFGGLVGLAVDAMTGGLYNLNPNQIQGTMVQGSISQQGKPPETAALPKNGLYFVVVLHADPSWQRIGTLRPAVGQ